MENNPITIKKNLLKLIQELPKQIGEDEFIYVASTVLANAIVLIEKGYDINQDLSELLENHETLNSVPENIQILDKENG